MGEVKKTFLKIKEKLESAKKRIITFKKKQNSRKKPIDTTITIKTIKLCEEIKNYANLNKYSIFLSVFSAVLSVYSVYKTIKVEGTEATLVVICSFAIIILAIVCGFKSIKTPSPVKFTNKIIRQQYDNEEFTAIFLVKMVFDNIPKILVFRSQSWNSFFLPYCNYDETVKETKNLIPSLQKQMSETFEVDFDDLILSVPYNKYEKTTIKKNASHNSISRINYKFFSIEFKNAFLKNRFINDTNSHFIWKTKYELLNDSETKLKNGDVLDTIDEFSLINQTPVAFKEWKGAGFGLNSKLRIIWNLTNQCKYECPICATNSGKDKVCKIDHEKKKSILLALSSINGFIEKLDISGGDPLLDPKDRKLIRLINQSFPYSKVIITTTSEGLEGMSANELVETVRECDITYDIPYNECIPTCREYAYNLNNIRKLEQLRNSGINIEFNIHIPIHPQTTKKEMIESILEDLYRIQPKSIKFIRLMPVGRMGKESIEDYQPGEFLSMVKEIAKTKKYDFDMSLNCSLRVKCGKAKCNMKREKIGIDCEGNVFTCIWGAYIPEFLNNIENNPFYLGNLLEETMYEILTSPKSIKYFKDKKEPADYCRVCSYVYNNDMDNPKDGLENFEFNWDND